MSANNETGTPSSVVPVEPATPPSADGMERLVGIANASGADRLRAGLKDRRVLALIGLLCLAQASGRIDLSQVFVWIGLAPRAEDVWGSRWGSAVPTAAPAVSPDASPAGSIP